ncbi:hypothetical protein ACFOEZ_02820 [Tianweitania populi]|uniref:Uncharacterized protein n=1 Tax=Tianweitania populi TaxID=1607949 RepID=A0A8J3GIX0_9HYPH|nr:hypothetical protein [Tianweitania populi]GHD06457.1 hypothetical protein GCM10016234_03830 [Tianweitania populi]
MTAKVGPTWAALRAIYEGARPTLPILATAGRIPEDTIFAKALRDKWVDAYAAGTGAGRKLRLQGRIEKLEKLIDTLIGESEASPTVDKSRIDMIGVLFRAIEKLKDMVSSQEAEAQAGSGERDERVGTIIQRIDQRILDLARGTERGTANKPG